MTFEFAAAAPSELAIAMLHISFVHARVLICPVSTALLPVALSVFHSVIELSRIDVSVVPSVLAKAFGLSPVVLAHVLVPYRKDVNALTVSETGFPLSFVLIRIAPSMLSKAVGLICPPLPDVVVACNSLPDAIALLVAFNPLAFVELSALPDIFALAPNLSLLVLSFVSVAI
jgi:hypothetical protein